MNGIDASKSFVHERPDPETDSPILEPTQNTKFRKYIIYAEPLEESYVSIKGIFSKTEMLDIVAEMFEEEEALKEN